MDVPAMASVAGPGLAVARSAARRINGKLTSVSITKILCSISQDLKIYTIGGKAQKELDKNNFEFSIRVSL